MSKLPNVKGRISYITSHAKQENLYATYRTADNTFWKNLARESQQEFQRSGTNGKCIEARELIIALPEIYTTFDPQQVLEEFTDKFRQQYGVECVSALHHNKRKTNYHIHLIWSSERGISCTRSCWASALLSSVEKRSSYPFKLMFAPFFGIV